MIVLTGASGRGTQTCTIYMPNRETSGTSYCNVTDLDQMLPPWDMRLPPPDSKWYSCRDSAYGPTFNGFEVGDILSHDDRSNEWNPCQHSTAIGTMQFRGSLGELCPFWRIFSTTPRSDCTAAVTGVDGKPVPTGQFLSVMKGRPCTQTDKRVFNNLGAVVNQSITNNNDGARYWYTDSILPGNIASPSVQVTLRNFGRIYTQGEWYARGLTGTVVTDPTRNVHWIRSVWTCRSRATFVREQWVEYHTRDSYTPSTQTAYTKLEYCKESNHRVTTFVITDIRSDSPGRFQVKFDTKTELEWRGWAYPNGVYTGSKEAEAKASVYAVLVLSPGLTTQQALPLDKVNQYCRLGKLRALQLHNYRDSVNTRVAAIRDVQALDSNWIENLSGLKGTMDVINPLLDGMKAIECKDLALARKSLASAYLVYSYVIKPGLSDYSNVKGDGIRIFNLATHSRFSRERRRGMVSVDNVPVCETRASLLYAVTYHLVLRSNFFSQIWVGLEKLGLDPSAGQLWDCVPFSFVVDWFANVGDSLRNIDAFNSLKINRDVLSRIESFKVQWPIEEKVLNDLFDDCICSNGMPLLYSWYDRRIYGDVGQIDPIAISTSNGPTFGQMSQGTALLTQMF